MIFLVSGALGWEDPEIVHGALEIARDEMWSEFRKHRRRNAKTMYLPDEDEGANKFAREWAEANGVKVRVFDAKRDWYAPREAEARRNKKMVAILWETWNLGMRRPARCLLFTKGDDWAQKNMVRWFKHYQFPWTEYRE